MHTISIFVDQNRMPKLASYFECQTHLAKNLRPRRKASGLAQNRAAQAASRRKKDCIKITLPGPV